MSNSELLLLLMSSSNVKQLLSLLLFPDFLQTQSEEKSEQNE